MHLLRVFGTLSLSYSAMLAIMVGPVVCVYKSNLLDLTRRYSYVILRQYRGTHVVDVQGKRDNVQHAEQAKV